MRQAHTKMLIVALIALMVYFLTSQHQNRAWATEEEADNEAKQASQWKPQGPTEAQIAAIEKKLKADEAKAEKARKAAEWRAAEDKKAIWNHPRYKRVYEDLGMPNGTYEWKQKMGMSCRDACKTYVGGTKRCDCYRKADRSNCLEPYYMSEVRWHTQNRDSKIPERITKSTIHC